MIFRLGLIIGMTVAISAWGQDEVKRNMYYGNEAFNNGDYEKAAGYYLDAVDQSPLNYKANFNLANAYYRMNQHEKAMERLSTIADLAPSSYDKSKAYHNLGNAHMMKQDLEGAIDAYKSSLRLNPSDEQTRYNLAYAQALKREQDKQNQENNPQNSNGEGQNMGDNQNGENQNGDSQNADENQDDNNDSNNNDEQQEENDGQDEDQGNQGKDPQKNGDKEDGNGQGYTSKLSKEQIQDILEAYYKREKELQKKIDKNKRIGYGSPQKKDW